MKKYTVIISTFVLLLVGFYFRNDLVNLYLSLTGEIINIQKNLPESLIEEIKTEVIAPPPLKAIQDLTTQTTLTDEGVITWTNSQRAANGGLVPLKENAKLDAAALAKVKDMFKNQYFEHDSPSGVGPSQLADSVGYNYILIGENLALGNYGNDEALVQAWMDSPGHRANILNKSFQEIGVAVMAGTFQGRQTWLAVQEFGLPLSVCGEPSSSLKAQIDADENDLKNLQQQIDDARAQIDSRNGRDAMYNQTVSSYNDLVNQYDLLLSQTKNLVEQYNGQVSVFNQCAASF